MNLKTGEIYPETLAIHAVYNENLELTHYFAIFHDITTDIQMRKEIELAGQIQRKILRSDFIHQRLCMKSIYLPYHYLSGDSYDYRWDKDNQVFNGFLFDVMGHGIASSLQASALRAIYRYVVSKQLSLSEKMHWLNAAVQATKASREEDENGVQIMNQAGEVLNDILKAVQNTVKDVQESLEVTDSEVASSERFQLLRKKLMLRWKPWQPVSRMHRSWLKN